MCQCPVAVKMNANALLACVCLLFPFPVPILEFISKQLNLWVLQKYLFLTNNPHPQFIVLQFSANTIQLRLLFLKLLQSLN